MTDLCEAIPSIRLTIHDAEEKLVIIRITLVQAGIGVVLYLSKTFDICGDLCKAAHWDRTFSVSFSCTLHEAVLIQIGASFSLYARVHEVEEILHTGVKDPIFFAPCRPPIRLLDNVGESTFCALSVSHVFVWASRFGCWLLKNPELSEIDFVLS